MASRNFVCAVLIILAITVPESESKIRVTSMSKNLTTADNRAHIRGAVIPTECGGEGTFRGLEISGCSTNPCTIKPGSTIKLIKIQLIPVTAMSWSPEITVMTNLSNGQTLLYTAYLRPLEAFLENEIRIWNFQTNSSWSGDAEMQFQVKNNGGVDEICIYIEVRFSNRGADFNIPRAAVIMSLVMCFILISL